MLTSIQIAAIVMLLQAFGVAQSTIDTVTTEITPVTQTVQSQTTTATTSDSSVGTTTPVFGAVATSSPCDNSLTITPQSSDPEIIADNRAYYFNVSAVASCFTDPITWSLAGPDPRLTYTRNGWSNDIEDGMVRWTVASRPHVPGVQTITVGVNDTYATTTAWAE